MRIAVVGDVHGHLALLYAILGRWQRETERPIHLILQVGDLGAFARRSLLDRATQRRVQADPEELGFKEFAGERPPGTLMDPRPPLVFIPGNHEDHDYLERMEAAAAFSLVYPVSQDGKILGLRSGRVWQWSHQGRTIRIGGVSGIAGRSTRRSYHPRVHLAEADAQRLRELGPGGLDLFISHERPSAIPGPLRHDLGGSEALTRLLEVSQAKLAFFGHYDQAGEWPIGHTRVIGLTGCGYEQRGAGPVKRRGIVVVDWKDAGPEVEWVEPDWLAGTRLGEWRHWR
jgi:hypothetical protein